MKRTLNFTKALIVFLLFLLIITHIGCGRKAESSKETKIIIGVSMGSFSAPYAAASVKELKRYTQQKGYGLVLLNSDMDILKEANNIDNLMSRKVDAILVNVIDSKGSRVALKKAADAGFIVNCFGSSVTDVEALGIRAFTGPPYYEQGAKAAKAAIESKPDGKVVIVSGTPGYSATRERERGFLDTITKEGLGIKVLDIQSGNWMREDAQRLMSDYITKYGKQIDIVYALDDNMAAGVINALKAAGYTLQNKPLVLSIGAMADGLSLVKEGWIDFTIMQSPKEDVHLAVDTAIDIINGKQIEQYRDYIMDTPRIDKSNVQEVIDMHIWD